MMTVCTNAPPSPYPPPQGGREHAEIKRVPKIFPPPPVACIHRYRIGAGGKRAHRRVRADQPARCRAPASGHRNHRLGLRRAGDVLPHAVGVYPEAKTDGTAYWSLIGISFIYGIFHAAGPGHGKAVISSYLVANEETWRRGIALSFASALLQALTAIVIVSVAAGLIGATAKMMGDTVRVIEIVSYSLIVLVGVRLLWVKGRGFLRALHAVRSEVETASSRPCSARRALTSWPRPRA